MRRYPLRKDPQMNPVAPATETTQPTTLEEYQAALNDPNFVWEL